MRLVLPLLLGLFLFQGCIPIRIAPNISDYKIAKGRRFKRGLPKKTVFVFKDPKHADDFYNYVNTKFQLDDSYVDVQVPFVIENNTYYFSFYEVSIDDKEINFVPLIFDVTLNAALGNEEMETYAVNDENSLLRKGNWYIAIEVFSDSEKDCLHEKSTSRKLVLAYLRDLKKEYLSTHNYNEVLFKD